MSIHTAIPQSDPTIEQPMLLRPRLAEWRPRASWPVLLPALAWLGLVALLPAQPVEPAAIVAEAAADPASEALRRERLRLLSEALLWPLGLAPAEAQSTSPQRSERRAAKCPGGLS